MKQLIVNGNNGGKLRASSILSLIHEEIINGRITFDIQSTRDAWGTDRKEGHHQE
jgi:hypothetical protein